MKQIFSRILTNLAKVVWFKAQANFHKRPCYLKKSWSLQNGFKETKIKLFQILHISFIWFHGRMWIFLQGAMPPDIK